MEIPCFEYSEVTSAHIQSFEHPLWGGAVQLVVMLPIGLISFFIMVPLELACMEQLLLCVDNFSAICIVPWDSIIIIIIIITSDQLKVLDHY